MVAESSMIVIASDDGIYLELMEELLVDEGYRVTTTASNHEAATRVVQVSADLAIIDLYLLTPDTAATAVYMLRLSPTTSSLPILLCSTNTERAQSAVGELATMGCHILAKPFTVDTMLDEVRALLTASVRYPS